MLTNYKIVFFDSGSSLKHFKIDKSNFFYISTYELRNNPDIVMVTYPLDYMFFLIRWVSTLCTMIADKYSHLSFLRKMWYPLYFPRKFKKNEKVCFVVYGYYIKPDYLRYLKKRYTNCKIVKLHRDSYYKWRDRNPEYTDSDVNELFDLNFSFDIGESERLNMIHFDDFCSKVDDIITERNALCDVFFAGAAKDRLNDIVSAYDRLASLGLKCYFYITKCPQSEQLIRDGIVYADEPMSYKKMIYYSVNSNAILEINQKGIDGYTSRFLESVMYNKKLITNNLSVKNSKFYNPKYILCFDDFTDITADFFNECTVDFGYNGEFSPKHFINQLYNCLDAMN